MGGNENVTPLLSLNMFITCMNALMSLQSLSLCEGFTASLTRKGSFARMNQLKERNANKNCLLRCFAAYLSALPCPGLVCSAL